MARSKIAVKLSEEQNDASVVPVTIGENADGTSRTAREILESIGVKPSIQRISVYECLMENPNHLTADCIYEKITQKMESEGLPPISKATVYNTLGLFVEKQLASTMMAGRNDTRYDPHTEPHGHFVCRICDKIINFPYDYKDKYESLKGCKIESKEIVLKGVCSECAKKSV